MTAHTIDEFLAHVSADKRAALEKLRRTIHATVPKAEECISYGVPAFRLDGKLLTGRMPFLIYGLLLGMALWAVLGARG